MQRNLPPEQIARTLERMVGVEYDLQHADEVPPSEGDSAHSLYVIRKLQRSGPTPQELSVQHLYYVLDGVVFEVLEDPDDGYRSHMAGVLARSDRDYSFYDKPFARIQIEKISDDVGSQDAVEKMHGYRLVDVEDGHVWLMFGTEWYDDYYPMFRFEYKPKDEA